MSIRCLIWCFTFQAVGHLKKSNKKLHTIKPLYNDHPQDIKIKEVTVISCTVSDLKWRVYYLIQSDIWEQTFG